MNTTNTSRSESRLEQVLPLWLKRLIVFARRQVLRFLPNENQHLFALTLVVGVVCGLIAVAFHLAIHGAERLLIERALAAPKPWWIVATILTPTIGGLLVGIALSKLVPGARGSGIPQVKHAFVLEGGRIRLRDAIGKFVLSAFQIGSGASLGREGPTVHICSSVASMLARATGLPAPQARRLMPVGVAAGIAAAFNAPIAAVTFTIEEIVGTLDQAVLSGVVIAAALAAVIERSVLGAHPVIEGARGYSLDHVSSIPIYAVLGLAAAVVSVAFTDGLLSLRRWFREAKPLPEWAQPATGGFATGVLAVSIMGWLDVGGINGGGYAMMGKALAGELALEVLAALCLAKLLATVSSYSSGGAGGIFAPSLFIGAMLGGVFGHLDVATLDHEQRQLGAFALVGMGAVFAGVVRAPITSVLIIFEMTDGYGLVLPLMLANMTSYVIAKRLRPTPIYEALLEQDGLHLPRPRATHHERKPVSLVMTRNPLSVTAAMKIGEVREFVRSVSFHLLPVIERGVVRGVVRLSRLVEAPPTTAIEVLLEPAEMIRDDESVIDALRQMSESGNRHLVVIDKQQRLVGMLSLSDVTRAFAPEGPEPALSEPPPSLG